MQPLKGKTIVITRSANQAEKFINQLESLGAKTISLPLITTTPINQEKLKSAIKSTHYNWLIFTSTNAVQFFFESIDANSINSKIAVVGEKTKQAIEQIGLQVDFIPSQYTAKQLAEELPISENDTILIPRSNLAKNDSAEILEGKNGKVKSISIYTNNSVEYSETELAKIFNQQIDYITFTSGSTIQSFIKLGIEVKNEKIVCIGPETAKTARENKLPVAAIANPHTIEGMVEELIKLSSSSS